jgi:predicted Zn-dependent protease
METPMKITPNDYFTDAAVTNIAEHELGHVLGLDHEDDNPKSIMYHSVGSDPRIISEKSYCLVQILLSVSGY